MQGIYKITNLINNHSYIGQSVNIEARLKTHFKRAFTENESDPEYNKALYVAIRKYGKDNFKTEILEELPFASRQELNIRESFWITQYNTYNDGYNETFGGDGVSGALGEKHHNHKLTESDVIDIRYRWAACEESVQQIFEDYSYKIGKSGFKKIYTWQTWNHILPELYTEQNKNWHKQNAKNLFSFPGEQNPMSKLSNAQVIEARKRYQEGQTIKQIYEDYKHTGIALGSFRNTICGHNRKNIN